MRHPRQPAAQSHRKQGSVWTRILQLSPEEKALCKIFCEASRESCSRSQVKQMLDVLDVQANELEELSLPPPVKLQSPKQRELNPQLCTWNVNLNPDGDTRSPITETESPAIHTTPVVDR